MMTAAESRAARQRGRVMLKHLPRAVSAKYDGRLNRVLVTLTNQLEVAIAPERVQILQNATPAQLRSVEVTPPGFELYFPKLDDGLWLPTLLQGTFGTRKWQTGQKERSTVNHKSVSAA